MATAWTQPCVAALFWAFTHQVSYFESVVDQVTTAPGETSNPPPSAFSPAGEEANRRSGLARPRSVSRQLAGGFPPKQPDRAVRFCYGKRTNEST